MENTSRDTSSRTDSGDANLDLDILKQHPQLQQLLLMTLSAIKQQQNAAAKATLDNDKRKFDQLDTRPLPDITALSGHGSPGSDSSSEKMLGRPGRKPLTEDEIKKSEMDPKSKRKAQNRAAQRAFRERRVTYVKELEDRIKALEENQDAATEKIMDENKQLKKIIQQLQMENAILGGTASSFDIPLSQQISCAADNTNGLILDTERPQKLLRSIGENSIATLLSATTTQQQVYDPSSNSSSSFTAPSQPGSSSSSPSLPPTLPSNNNQSITSSDTYSDDVLSSSTLPTDILSTFDTSQLIQSFGLDANQIDPELFHTLTTSAPESIPISSSSSTTTTAAALPPNNTNDVANNDTTSNDWMESLLVTGDDDTDSSSSAAAATTHQEHHSPYHSTDHEHQSLPQVWDKLTEHPRFDEFDIDLLCDEMTRKAVCNDGTPCNNKSHHQKMKETIHQYYPSPSFC